MSAIEEAPIHLPIDVPSSSSPQNPQNASDRPQSDDQESPNQNPRLHLHPHPHPHHQLSLNARQYSPILNAPQVVNPGQPDSNRFGEVKELEEMFSKLNPLAKEFVPPSLTNPSRGSENGFWLDPSLRLGDGGVNPSFGRQWVL